MRTNRLFAMAMMSLAAVAASATRAAAQGAKAHVRIEVVQPAIPMQAVQHAVTRAAVDSIPVRGRWLPAGARLERRDRPAAVTPATSPASPAQRPRTVRVITLAYTAN